MQILKGPALRTSEGDIMNMFIFLLLVRYNTYFTENDWPHMKHAEEICRSYHTTPVFSTDEPGASKFKMERFLQPGQNSVATIFAPISYPPLPLLAFKQDESSQQYTLVGTGALKSCNPDRVVLKRIVLSGYPVKVTKKKAVVRWMFHNPDDVRWFRPLDLWTKHGLRGRIKVSIISQMNRQYWSDCEEA